MKRWLAKLVGSWLAGGVSAVLAMSVLSGCGQNTFLTEEVYKQAHTAGLPTRSEDSSCPVTAPITALTPAPPIVSQPDRKPRPLTLQEAIAIALDNGTVSSRSGSGRGLVNDELATFTGGTTNLQSDRMRVISLAPAVHGAVMEATEGRFDPVWNTHLNYTGTDNLLQGLSSFNNGHGAQFQSSIVKQLASGGIANISFLTNYTNLTSPPTGTFGVLNPNYTARLSFGFEQPLWRDFGTEINLLNPRPSQITGLAINGTQAAAAFNAHQSAAAAGAQTVGLNTEGIVIARLRFDQSRAEFERNVQVLLLNTEVAYWNLYNKYGQLYSFEENLRFLQRAIFISEKRDVAGKEDKINYHQTRGQFQEFRGERVRALQEVLEAERNLRGILGMPNEDGDRLIPITPPTLAEYKPNWEHCLQDALNTRPELAIARDNLRYHQYLLTIQKNLLKPDLRAYARWEPVGVGSSLTGTNSEFIDGTGSPRTTNAFQSLAGSHFTDYQFGVNLTVPLGYRFENAAVRAARLQLSQSYWFLRDQEDKATRFLQQQYQELDRWYRLIETTQNERLGYQNALKILIHQAKVGTKVLGEVQSLEIQRRYASAYVKEYNAIAEYNNSLARLEWAKGTMLRHNNVHISEGPLPQAAQVRAIDEEKRRSEAFVLRHRPDALTQPGRVCANREDELFDDHAPVLGELPTAPPPPVAEKEAAAPKVPGILAAVKSRFQQQPSSDAKAPTLAAPTPKEEPIRGVARPLDIEFAPVSNQDRNSFDPDLRPLQPPRDEPTSPLLTPSSRLVPERSGLFTETAELTPPLPRGTSENRAVVLPTSDTGPPLAVRVPDGYPTAPPAAR